MFCEHLMAQGQKPTISRAAIDELIKLAPVNWKLL
jgi:hypothetical protein